MRRGTRLGELRIPEGFCATEGSRTLGQQSDTGKSKASPARQVLRHARAWRFLERAGASLESVAVLRPAKHRKAISPGVKAQKAKAEIGMLQQAGLDRCCNVHGMRGGSCRLHVSEGE